MSCIALEELYCTAGWLKPVITLSCRCHVQCIANTTPTGDEDHACHLQGQPVCSEGDQMRRHMLLGLSLCQFWA